MKKTSRIISLLLSAVLFLLTPCTAAAENDLSHFKDVLPGHLYYSAIKFVVDNGYFNGVSEDTFAPGEPMTRAMFVTVLGRLAGVDPATDSTTDFIDVTPESYYSGYVAWAVENGIVQGLDDKLFGPHAHVTREQIAVFLYRYAKHIGMDVSIGQIAQPHTSAGDNIVSPWAMTAMVWANNRGIMNGTGSGMDPQAEATRAQVAQMLSNFAQLTRN